MSKSIKAFAVLGLVVLVSACAQQEEPAPEPVMEPVMAEPTMDKM